MSDPTTFTGDVEELITMLRSSKGEVFEDTQGKTISYYATIPEPTVISAALFKELIRRKMITAEKASKNQQGHLKRQKYFLHEAK
jgi:hypothetical protein